MPYERWYDTLDAFKAAYRRLRQENGFPIDAEIHAAELATNDGPWRDLKLTPRQRFGIYKLLLRQFHHLAPVTRNQITRPGVQVLAVVLPDREDPGLEEDAEALAWRLLLERLETFCRIHATQCTLWVDAGGHQATMTKVAREQRRFRYVPSAQGTEALARPFMWLVEDPVAVESSSSLFIQWADLLAYAGFRAALPHPQMPKDLWAATGRARLAAANWISRDRGATEPIGVVIWPRPMEH